MHIDDYLGKDIDTKRILIVGNNSKNTAIARKYEKNNKIIHNVEFMDFSKAISNVYRYIRSQQCLWDEFEVINDDIALVVFRKVVLECISNNNLKYFTNSSIMNNATCREIMNKVNLVRTIGWQNNASETNDRTRDIETLITSYEARLQLEKKLDNIAVLKYILANEDSWKNNLSDIFGGEVSILYEDMCYNAGIQQQFLNLLNTSQNEEDFVIRCHVKENLSVDDLQQYKDKMSFFKGYGPFNEVNYVVNDIYEKGYPLGSVTILYTNSGLIPAISAGLGGNGINTRIVSSHPYGHNEYISLARLIIDWAKDNFSEKALKKVLESRVISVEKNKSDSIVAKNTLYGSNYFGHVKQAANRRENSFVLGWGYDRNREFIKRERLILDDTEADINQLPDGDDKTKATQRLVNSRAVLDLHEALLDIFTKDGKCLAEEKQVQVSEVFGKILEFCKTYISKLSSFKIGYGMLKTLYTSLSYDDTPVTYREALDYIADCLINVEGADEKSGSAVEVKSLSSFSIIEREHVYVIGLSFKDMYSNPAESSVLSDAEMIELLQDGYKPTLEAEEKKKYQNIYKTLCTFSGESITFGYSTFDTAGFIKSNPSNLMRNLLKVAGVNLDDLPEFIYGNPQSEKKAEAPEGSDTYTIPDEFKGFQKKGATVRTTSNSSMENLIKCPLSYAYSRIMGIPDDEVTEEDDSQWLDQRLLGSFFHELADAYCKEILIKELKYDSVNVDFLTQKANEMKLEFLDKAPAPFDDMAEGEIKNIVAMAQRLINRIISSHKNEGWKVLLSEKRFDQYGFDVSDFNKNKYTFYLNGEIDRIDYKLDTDNKTIIIRVADYKTGSKKGKNDQHELGLLFQDVVYRNAILGQDADGKTPICDAIYDQLGLDSKDWEIVFNNFQYEFPKETSDEEPLAYTNEDIDSSKALIRLQCVLTAVYENNNYPNALDVNLIIPEYGVTYVNECPQLVDLKCKVKESCTYCSYKDLCTSMREGLIE